MAQRGRPRGGDEQRERILRAVAPLIAEQGAAAVRLRDVADRADVSVGMIQHYFDRRERLMQEAARHYLLEVVANLGAGAARDEDPWDRLVAFADIATSSTRIRRRAAIWLDLVATASRDKAAREMVLQVQRAWAEALVEIIDAGVAAGQFAPVAPPQVVADSLVALVDGLDVTAAIRLPGADQAWRQERFLTTARALLAM